MLLTFTKISDDVFPKTTEAVLDVATAMHTDLESASKMVGKALNDPLKGLTALSRAGVQFTAQQKDQITKMVENNDLLGAQKVILKELSTQMGGSARAQARTFAGQVEQLSNEFNDLLEGVGKVVVAVGDGLLPLMKDSVDWFQDLGDKASWLKEQLDFLPWDKMVEGTSLWNNTLVNNMVPSMQLFNDVMDAMPEKSDKVTMSQAKLVQAFEDGKVGAEALIHNLLGLSDGADETGGKVRGLGRTVHHFAGMTGKELKEWRVGVGTSIKGVLGSLDTFEGKWKGSAKTLEDTLDGMRVKAGEFRQNLNELARSKWVPEDFKQFLIEQGPDAIHNFAEANRAAKDRMVTDFQGLQPSMNAIDGILKRMGTKLDGLNNRTVTIPIRLDVQGLGTSAADRTVADALASELIHQQI
jgi:hypothetical protein